MIKIKIEAQNGADLRNQLKQLLGESTEPAFELKPYAGESNESVNEVFSKELLKLVSNNGYSMADVNVSRIFNTVLQNRSDKNLDELFEAFTDAYNSLEMANPKEAEEKPKRQKRTTKKVEEKYPEPEPEEKDNQEEESEDKNEDKVEDAPEDKAEDTPEAAELPKITMAELQTKVKALVEAGKKPDILKILEDDFKVSRIPDIKEDDLPKFYQAISKL